MNQRTFLSRYQSGREKEVWDELRGLGPRIREPHLWDDVYATAVATMQRVKQNIEIVHARLQEVGYRFDCPAEAHVPPGEHDTEMIEEIESRIGPLPLSLRAFYKVVGSVDFSQSEQQLVAWHESGRETADDVEVLGEEDPLYVAPLSILMAEVTEMPPEETRLYFYFASDEFHKANYSGGENYHVWLPDPNADFRIVGMYGIDEYFVDNLRHSLRWRGFRGRVEVVPGDEDLCRKVTPQLSIVRFLGQGLLEF